MRTKTPPKTEVVNGRRPALEPGKSRWWFVYYDIILGVLGSVAVVVGLAILLPYAFALIAGGVALIALAMVVPEWD